MAVMDIAEFVRGDIPNNPNCQKQPAQIRQVKTSEPCYVEINRKDLGRTFGWKVLRWCLGFQEP